MGKTYTDEEFDHLCFEYGIELDDVTSEREMLSKELKDKEGLDVEGVSDDVIYRIDIPANRYDMLCIEGISRALNIFRGVEKIPKYTLANMEGKPLQQMIVKPETALVRPFVVCAILRGVTLDSARYNSFIDLQDKLHQNLCRQRTLVAIGTHDLATIKGPFTYEALPPNDIRFVPLKQQREFAAGDLLDHYLENDLKLRKFVPIIKDSAVYPVIYDADRTVLSLPPIINGAHSAITLDTRDIFIECTATDLTKAKVALNTVVCMFSEYCSSPFEVEPVEVIDASGSKAVYPELNCREMEVSIKYVRELLGLTQVPTNDLLTLLSKMQLVAETTDEKDSQGQVDGSSEDACFKVLVPPTRSDVLHACDVAEDVAIAYGYNNLPKPSQMGVGSSSSSSDPASSHISMTEGRELPLNQVSEALRLECAMAGFTEILTWALVSKAENFQQLLRPDDGKTAVEIGNPATVEFEVCRTSLLSSALKTVGANKENALPIKLFELSDVVLLDPQMAVGARNERRLVAVYCGKESGFEVIHGLLNRLMEVLGVPHKDDLAAEGKEEGKAGSYHWAPSNDPAFFPGRQASVFARGKEVGVFGIIHPDVCSKFEIPYALSALEINVEPFVFDQFYEMLM